MHIREPSPIDFYHRTDRSVPWRRRWFPGLFTGQRSPRQRRQGLPIDWRLRNS